MSVNTEVFDIPTKKSNDELNLQEQRVNFFNSILEMASTTKATKITKTKEPKEAKPKADKKKPEFTDEQKTKMLENLQKGREKRRANITKSSEPKQDAKQPEVKPQEVKQPEVKQQEVKEDPEYEEWKKHKQAKAQIALQEQKQQPSQPILQPVIQAATLNVYRTYKKPLWK